MPKTSTSHPSTWPKLLCSSQRRLRDMLGVTSSLKQSHLQEPRAANQVKPGHSSSREGEASGKRSPPHLTQHTQALRALLSPQHSCCRTPGPQPAPRLRREAGEEGKEPRAQISVALPLRVLPPQQEASCTSTVTPLVHIWSA